MTVPNSFETTPHNLAKSEIMWVIFYSSNLKLISEDVIVMGQIPGLIIVNRSSDREVCSEIEILLEIPPFSVG